MKMKMKSEIPPPHYRMAKIKDEIITSILKNRHSCITERKK